MKIAWSCAGEGFGHAARLAALWPHLGSQYEMDCFVPAHLHGFLKEKGVEARFHDIPSLQFAKEGDRIRYLKTLWRNLPVLQSMPMIIHELAKALTRGGVDMVVSDFEPLLARAGKKAGIPVLQLNHPGIIANFPGGTPASFFSRAGARFMEGPWDQRLLVSFFHGDAGPLLRPGIRKLKARDEGFILFNLKPAYRPAIQKILDTMPGLKYRIFPDPAGDFEDSLAACSGVVTSAGHQIIAESLLLGKPVLAIPQRGQYEQILNARMLQSLGRGLCGSLDRLHRELPAFIERLPALAETCAGELPPGFTLEDGIPRILSGIQAFALQHVERAWREAIPARCPNTEAHLTKSPGRTILSAREGQLVAATPGHTAYPAPGGNRSGSHQLRIQGVVETLALRPGLGPVEVPARRPQSPVR